MTPDDAARLISRDPKNREVLFPYLNGEDLYQRPDSSPSRWVVDFRDRSEAEARRWPDCWDWIEKRVKPERMEKDATKYPKMVEKWWQHWNMRPDLFGAIRGLRRFLAISRVGRVGLPVFVPAGVVASDATVVFAYEDTAHFALLSSAIHYWWAIANASTMRTDLRYTPTDVFETFPQPESMTQLLQNAGDSLDLYRPGLMLDRSLGLTALYDLVNNPNCIDAEIRRLRDIHAEIGSAAADAYGWSDLDLDFGFQTTRQGVRWDPGEATRIEVLDRLRELNAARHEAEADGGLPARRRTRSRKNPEAKQLLLVQDRET
jgi:MmeI, target recognition domain